MKYATVTELHKKTDRTECGRSRGISLVAHASEGFFEEIANHMSNYFKREDILPGEPCGIRSQRSTIDTIFVIARLHQMAKKRATLFTCASSTSPKHTIQSTVLSWRPFSHGSACYRRCSRIFVTSTMGCERPHGLMAASLRIGSAWSRVCIEDAFLVPLLF